MSDNSVQVSGRIGEMIFVLGGKSPEEFLANARVILGEDATDLQDMFKMALVGSGAQASVEKQAVANAIDGGFTPAAATPAAPAAAAPAGAVEPATEEDRFGNRWTYGVPGAPVGPHGPKVMKEGKSKAGKAYKAWMCYTHSPSAYRKGIKKDESVEPEWIR